MPISFEYSWKVGDIITDESGLNKCEIITIEDEKDIDFQSIKKHNSSLIPKHLYKNRESLNQKIKNLHKYANCDTIIQYLNAVNLSIDDFNYKNISKSFTKLIVNNKHLATKIIKRDDFNTLNFTYISNYLEEEIKDIKIV